MFFKDNRLSKGIRAGIKSALYIVFKYTFKLVFINNQFSNKNLQQEKRLHKRPGNISNHFTRQLSKPNIKIEECIEVITPLEQEKHVNLE